jgi:pimeloyl-ACP methyl ester carboxylesterase
MKSTHHLSRIARQVALPVTALAVTLHIAATAAAAQDVQGVISAQAPLVIKAQGSFYIDGRIVHSDAVSGQPGGLPFLGTNEGDIAVGQMYVQYQIPANAGRHVPVVMIHGGDLSGKTYETTPDGREGWATYFLRKGRPVYVPDQVSRARSGFDVTTINEVRLGRRSPSELPLIFVLPNQVAWLIFRFGPTYGTPFRNEQFPVRAAGQLARQVVPDFNFALPTPNPTLANLSRLAIRLRGAILMGHSESGGFPEQTALMNPQGIKGLITIESGCPATLTQEQLATLARIPILIVFGDHLADVPGSPLDWPALFRSCATFVNSVNQAGGDATMMHLPAMGIYGNSHMLMQDRNNLQLADLILRWIDQHVERHR